MRQDAPGLGSTCLAGDFCVASPGEPPTQSLPQTQEGLEEKLQWGTWGSRRQGEEQAKAGARATIPPRGLAPRGPSHILLPPPAPHTVPTKSFPFLPLPVLLFPYSLQLEQTAPRPPAVFLPPPSLPRKDSAPLSGHLLAWPRLSLQRKMNAGTGCLSRLLHPGAWPRAEPSLNVCVWVGGGWESRSRDFLK